MKAGAEDVGGFLFETARRHFPRLEPGMSMPGLGFAPRFASRYFQRNSQQISKLGLFWILFELLLAVGPRGHDYDKLYSELANFPVRMPSLN